MHFSKLLLTAGVVGHTALAYPQDQGLVGGLLDTLLVNQLRSLGNDAAAALQAPSEGNDAPTFNAKKQRISTSGLHEWRAPRPGIDQRGPCPGLNALANHGYISRTGTANIVEFALACNRVYNMGIDLATVLAAYGGIFNGAVVAWSIGGSNFTGIAGSHNNYEGDSSPTRGDLFQHGTNSDLILSHFKELLDRQPDPATADYNVDVIVEHRASRYRQSVEKNPWFYYGPFTSFVGAAAHVLIPAMFSNHSEEFPAGRLDQETLKSFFAITGNNDNLIYTSGHERIPDNWYKRPDGYTFGKVGDDIGLISERYPETLPIGCNMGQVNTFTLINTTDTDLDSYDFASPTGAVCYAYALAGSIVGKVPLVGLLVQMIGLPIQNALRCPTLPSVDGNVGQNCPGYSFRGGPTAPIAPGAIP